MEVLVKYFARPGDFSSEDLLSGNEQKSLYVECPGFENLSQPAPAGGWTHSILEELLLRPFTLRPDQGSTVNIFLEDQWIASSDLV